MVAPFDYFKNNNGVVTAVFMQKIQSIPKPSVIMKGIAIECFFFWLLCCFLFCFCMSPWLVEKAEITLSDKVTRMRKCHGWS